MDQLKNKRLLLVDDDGHYIRFLRRILLSRNYKIVGEAKTGEQALKLFKSGKPDLTLLDFEMPNANGDKILQEILGQNPDAKVIILTGRSDIEIMQLCLNKGAFHFMRKDYPIEMILSVIEESLKEFADKES